MRRAALVTAIAAISLVVVPAVTTFAPAPALAYEREANSSSSAPRTQKGVTINGQPARYVPYGKDKREIRASVKTTGNVKVTSKTVTISQAGRTLASNKTVAYLKPGSYEMVTKVTYKTYWKSGGKIVYSSPRTFTAKQTLTVKWSYTPANSKGQCPSWAPIKGNNNSMIYHVPGGRYYDKTTANVTCFVSKKNAERAGFRPSKY